MLWWCLHRDEGKEQLPHHPPLNAIAAKQSFSFRNDKQGHFGAGQHTISSSPGYALRCGSVQGLLAMGLPTLRGERGELPSAPLSTADVETANTKAGFVLFCLPPSSLMTVAAKC